MTHLGDITKIDGIGGFPLIWETLNGKDTCLWASEIEEFPIAVTKRHFADEIGGNGINPITNNTINKFTRRHTK